MIKMVSARSPLTSDEVELASCAHDRGMAMSFTYISLQVAVMDDHTVLEADNNALDLRTRLTQIGLVQYEQCLRDNGFENWETVQEITETDLIELGFKLGDRRKLQRAISEDRNSSASRIEPVASIPPSSQQVLRTTRTYRRHPRPDPNAPERPKTAYVLFGEHVRSDPTLSLSSFADIAKETGKRWRELSHEQRENTWQIPAADRLQQYKEELEMYKQTDNYQRYQMYLNEFRHQQSAPELTQLGDLATSTSEPAPSKRLPTPSRGNNVESSPQDGSDIEELVLEDQWQDISSPVKFGMEEVRHCLRSLGMNSRLLRVAAFPPEDMTTKAVKAFLQGTGSLLYLWDNDEVLDLVKSVYDPQNDWKPVHATEVFAMSAVGAYCDADFNSSIGERFLHFFVSMLCSPSELHDFRRMRLFACLAICRFTSNVESARRLMCKHILLLQPVHGKLISRSIRLGHWTADVHIVDFSR
jgi:hypothetical protein